MSLMSDDPKHKYKVLYICVACRCEDLRKYCVLSSLWGGGGREGAETGRIGGEA